MDLHDKLKEWAGLNGFEFVYGTMQYAELLSVGICSRICQCDPIEQNTTTDEMGYILETTESTNIALLAPSPKRELPGSQMYESKYSECIRVLKEAAERLLPVLSRCGGFKVRMFKVAELSGVLTSDTDGILISLTVERC